MRYKKEPIQFSDLNKSNWQFESDIGGYAYTLTAVAKDWGRLPSELGVCTPDMDIAVMVAFTQTRNLMATYEQEEQEREINRKRQLQGNKS